MLAVVALAPGCQRNKEKKKRPDPAAAELPPQSDSELATPLAKIDNVVITVSEFQDRINRQSPYVRGRYTSRENQREFLTNLIRFEVLAIEAARRGFDKDPDAVRAMKQVMIQKLMAAEFETAGKAETITDAELKAYYEANPNQYNKPEEVRVAAVILTSKARADAVAKQALGELGQTNKGFRDLVKKHSTDQETKIRGGDLRYFSTNNAEIPKPVIEAAFALTRTGAVAGPIDAGDGRFFIIKQTGRRKAVTKAFEKVKLQIRNRLARQKRSKAQREFIGGLKKKSKIEIFDANLKKVRVDQSKSSANQGISGGGHGDDTTIPGMPDEAKGAPKGGVAAPKDGLP